MKPKKTASSLKIAVIYFFTIGISILLLSFAFGFADGFYGALTNTEGVGSVANVAAFLIIYILGILIGARFVNKRYSIENNADVAKNAAILLAVYIVLELVVEVSFGYTLPNEVVPSIIAGVIFTAIFYGLTKGLVKNNAEKQIPTTV